MIIRLKGKSKHGKNRIAQFDDLWEVVGQRPKINVGKPMGPGPFLLIASVVKDDLRWVSKNDDLDFEIIEEMI